MKKIKAIIFDIDGTLTDGISWTALTRDIGGSVAEHLSIYEDHINGKIGLDASKRKLLDMWQATGKATRDHIEQIFETWPIKEEAYPLIRWLKEHGYVICLITGSLGVYAEHVAKRLDIKNYFANAELYFDKRGRLVDFHYSVDQAEVKLKQLEQFCLEQGLDVEECAAIGDSNNDIELFRQTGNGVLLDNGKIADELRSAAWQIVKSLGEVKSLLISR